MASDSEPGARDYIIANAQYHSKLLTTIADLDYIPQAKKNQTEFLKDLERQIAAGETEIEELSKQTNKERKEHETLRDSTARRFAHKMIGKKDKFSEMASKEEKEYVEALEREMTARDNQNARIKMLDDGKHALQELNDKETQHESAQAELKMLYNRAFEGPTPDFPEEDPLEYDYNAAHDAHSKAQAIVNSESRAGELLTKAVRSMEICLSNMREALSYSRYDMWGGGTMADMMERSALRQATVNAAQAKGLADQAARTSPQVQTIPALQIAEGSMLSDVFFDNIFTDMAFHDKIKQSSVHVVAALEKLKRERDATWRRLDAAGGVLVQASQKLDSRRREMDTYRRAVFESVAAQNPPPPSYSTSNTPEGSTNNLSRIGLPEAPAIKGDETLDPPPSSIDKRPGISEPQTSDWGTRNPFAFALSEQREHGVPSTKHN